MQARERLHRLHRLRLRHQALLRSRADADGVRGDRLGRLPALGEQQHVGRQHGDQRHHDERDQLAGVTPLPGAHQEAEVLADRRGTRELRRACVGPAELFFGGQLPMYGTASRISTVFWRPLGMRVRRLLADLLAVDRRAERRPGRVDVDRGAALLAGGEQERHLVVVADEPDGHRHAGAHHPLGRGGLTDLRGVQDLAEMEDPRLHLALLVLGRVVAAVLLQVALFAGGLDLLGDVDAPGPREILVLGLQAVVRLLRQPGDVLIARVGHGFSLLARGP